MLQEDERTCHNTSNNTCILVHVLHVHLDECNVNELQCSQSCFNDSDGMASCTCNHGYQLGSDGTSCHGKLSVVMATI